MLVEAKTEWSFDGKLCQK